MENINIQMKINALNKVLKKHNISNDKIDSIKKDFYNSFINNNF